jgi:hypothetical protein
MNGLGLKAKGLFHGLCPPEVFLLLLLLVTGSLALSHPDRPDPLSLLLPNWVSIVWDIALIVGSLICLGGILTLHWAIVRIGYTILCPVTAAYAIALLPHAHMLSIRINVATLLVFSLACLWRDLQITFTLRGAR